MCKCEPIKQFENVGSLLMSPRVWLLAGVGYLMPDVYPMTSYSTVLFPALHNCLQRIMFRECQVAQVCGRVGICIICRKGKLAITISRLGYGNW